MLKNFFNGFKKSVSFGQTLPSWKLNDYVNWSNWSTEKAINEGYKASTYVYSCVNLIARSTASVPWHVYKRTSNGWERVEGHPLELLIDRPNPFNSRKDFIERMTTHLYLGGNALFTKVRANNVVVELWSIPPDGIKVIPSPTNFISHYQYEKDGVKHRLETNDIIHNMFIDPANPYWGLSPLQAGAKVVDSDLEAVNWNKLALQNRAITDGIFTLNQNLTREQYNELRKQVREQHQGAENARTPWILGSGAQWQQMSLSPAEMDFIESRKFTREEICSIFQVPPPMVGILEKANYSNIETARKIFWLDTVIPYLEDIKNNLNLSLTPEFGEDLYLDYDVSNVEAIQENFKEKIDNARALWSMGVPFNDINQRLELGFDEIEAGDVGFLPSSVIPASMANMDMSEPPEPPKPPEEGETEDEDNEKKLPRVKNRKNNITRSEEHKTFYWKNNERRRASWYNNLTRKSARLFANEGNKVTKALEKDGLEGALKAIDESKSEWSTFFRSSWTSIVEEFGTEQWERLKPRKSQKDEGDAFNPWSSHIQGYIRRVTATKVTNVTDSTKKRIRAIVLNGRNNGESITDIARAIKTQYSDFSRYRSHMIGRTEVVGASNYGQYASATQTGLPLKREWVSSRDDRVRDSHDDMDGEVVGMDEGFSNGLQYPADYNAGIPEESINCRCTVAYIQD